jgi:hypothetical protein
MWAQGLACRVNLNLSHSLRRHLPRLTFGLMIFLTAACGLGAMFLRKIFEVSGCQEHKRFRRAFRALMGSIATRFMLSSAKSTFCKCKASMAVPVDA